ncbi:MAG: S1-like domain-containing RNA-binding protein [Campylobacterota bacterium]
MNETLHIGELNTLVIDRSTVPGLFLRALDGSDILLPNQYVTESMHVGDTIDVFVYTDSEDRPVATTLSPKAMLGEIAFLEVVDTAPIGAFVDWGLMKDLFVPKALQKRPFTVGEKRLVRVIRDEQTGRLVGTEKITGGLETPPRDFYPNTPVTFMIIAKTPLGYKAIVDHRYEGMIYANEIFEEVRVGQIKHGFVKQLRSDGKLDLSLQMTGKAKASGAAEKVYTMLQANGGMLPYNSKTDPELIQKAFGLSKKNFKAALTQLVADQKIMVKENGIYGI